MASTYATPKAQSQKQGEVLFPYLLASYLTPIFMKITKPKKGSGETTHKTNIQNVIDFLFQIGKLLLNSQKVSNNFNEEEKAKLAVISDIVCVG